MNERIQWNLRFRGTRGRSNQPSSRGIAIYHYLLHINVCIAMNKGFRWPEKEDFRYGGPTL